MVIKKIFVYLQTVRLHTIELKDVIEPLNEFGCEAPKDLRGFFIC